MGTTANGERGGNAKRECPPGSVFSGVRRSAIAQCTGSRSLAPLCLIRATKGDSKLLQGVRLAAQLVGKPELSLLHVFQRDPCTGAIVWKASWVLQKSDF